MPFTHARRRGATVLFRRNIPVDLRDPFGSHEIVRSIGLATPGEARRIVHRLWSQTELVFMRFRSEQGLTRDNIAKVVAAVVDAFRDDIGIAGATSERRQHAPQRDLPGDRGLDLRLGRVLAELRAGQRVLGGLARSVGVDLVGRAQR